MRALSHKGGWLLPFSRKAHGFFLEFVKKFRTHNRPMVRHRAGTFCCMGSGPGMANI
ncbi:hypothetical protein B4135_4169 [Caldibacillus debilis]|uniref:Uncharacterized protein n=1 Tax=Caldibacillus debilis TaxID=301148 RepID=A0A150L6R1_9BACI|nr:hypothetical protein B4135_4169 [Caldibacillus debilis]